jgi:hypothetical protein
MRIRSKTTGSAGRIDSPGSPYLNYNYNLYKNKNLAVWPFRHKSPYVNYIYNLYKKKTLAVWPFRHKSPYVNYNYNLYKKKLWPFGRLDIKVPM